MTILEQIILPAIFWAVGIFLAYILAITIIEEIHEWKLRRNGK